MTDHLLRIIAAKEGIRALICDTTTLSNEVCQRHQTSLLATAALSHALTGGVMLGSLIKVKQRVALRFAGDGPLGKLIVEADSDGGVRGYISQPDINLPPKLGQPDIAGGLGHGTLTIMKDVLLPELVEGIVPMGTGRIDKDIELYLNNSEQIPSFMAISTVFGNDEALRAAAGILLQALPDYDSAALSSLVERIEELPPIADMLAAGKSLEDITALVFGDMAYKILRKRDIQFKCGCSRERSAYALSLLDLEELHCLIDDGKAEVDCHFCHEKYIFDKMALESVLSKRM